MVARGRDESRPIPAWCSRPGKAGCTVAWHSRAPVVDTSRLPVAGAGHTGLAAQPHGHVLNCSRASPLIVGEKRLHPAPGLCRGFHPATASPQAAPIRPRHNPGLGITAGPDRGADPGEAAGGKAAGIGGDQAVVRAHRRARGDRPGHHGPPHRRGNQPQGAGPAGAGPCPPQDHRAGAGAGGAEFFTRELAALLATILGRIDQLNVSIDGLTAVIETLLEPYEEQLQQAESMPRHAL
jgi:hypothetical protein